MAARFKSSVQLMKLNRVAFGLQRLTKFFQEKLHIFRRGQRTHNPDAKDLPSKRTETTSDLDASIFDQTLPNFCFVDAFWNPHRVQGRNAVLLGNVHAQTHCLDALHKRLMAPAVPFPSVLNSLLRDDQQRLAQSVKHRNWRGMVVAVRNSRVVVNQFEVEIPTAHWRSTAVQELHRPRRHGHGRQPRRAAQPFLRAAVSDVDIRLVEIYLQATERGHTVRDYQRADIVSGGADRLS